MGFGTNLEWKLMQLWCNRLSLGIRRGKKEYLRYAAVLNLINVVLIMRIEHPCNTNDWYIGALLTEWTYTNQPLFQPHFLGLGEYFMGLICPEWCGILSIQYMAKQLSWRSLYIWLQQSVVKLRVLSSVSNGSGPSLRVRVRVGTEPEPDWPSGFSINPNWRFGYGSIDISLPVWIGWVPSVLYSGSICKFI